MIQLLERTEVKDYQAIAAALSRDLAASAIERDLKAGIPEEEVRKFKESGLLLLTIPKQYGGIGAGWLDAGKVIQELSKADGSIGQLYCNHLALVLIGEVVGTAAQSEFFYQTSAQNNLFWGNAINTRDTRLKIEPTGDHFRVNGIKTFGTGTVVADMRVFSAMQDGVDLPIFFVIPKQREGVIYNHDWENMGQRRTASGSFTFNNVIVYQDEIVGPSPVPDSFFLAMPSLIAQLGKTYVYLGIAEGALESAREYILTVARPWMNAGVDRASQDPYILRQYGELWGELQAAIALADRAAETIQAAWDKGFELTAEDRGEAAIAVATAKAIAIKAGTTITNRIFEVMGARATASRYGFDRYWRDLPTFSLHDPVDYKLKSIGQWVLSGEAPTPSQYS
ncbi:acyl-CoA dehydrogenase family protein [Leptothermofonsia sichuanensis E412]|uniref:acyl-CoA dehydrogenase family protein n=1 Tax=Leptothermofonsia sichuanensis TaxID=2917832 RepID=UPI001CA6D0E9|nr:acyl-CoA dehydrogenase family protein [Leptothermofonsia sichuanensis]QZZ21555.1 acyl-CoA dehydrogenase family protein [Leptothermofonsia sichuanensis E412]